MAYRKMNQKKTVPETKESLDLGAFLDTIEDLPGKMKNNFTEMHQLEVQSEEYMAAANKEAARAVHKSNGKKPNDESVEKSYETAVGYQTLGIESQKKKVEKGELALRVVGDAIGNLDETLRIMKEHLIREGTLPMDPKAKAPAARGSAGAGSSRRSRRARHPSARADVAQGSAGRERKKGTAVVPEVSEVEAIEEAVWCFCRQSYYGEMVECESGDCAYQWFHFDCVGLKVAPKGSWTCATCKEKASLRSQSG